MSIALHRLGHWIARHYRAVLLVWLVGLIGVLGLAVAAAGVLEDDFTIPGSESQQGIDNLATRFPEASGVTAQIVVVAPEGERVTDPEHRAAIEEMLDEVAGLQHIADVENPLAAEPTGGEISTDGRYSLSTVQFDVPFRELDAEIVDALETAAAIEAPLTAHVGGQVYNDRGAQLSATEFVGVGIAFLVLMITFGSALAAGLPLVMSLIGAAIALAGILITASVTTVSTTTPTFALMIGLAVGIDYGLFIVSRHRSELAGGASVAEAIARSLATAGSAIIFAGTTVVIALLGLALAGIPFLTVMGVAAASTVVVAVLGSLTLLPAIVVMAGGRLLPRPPRSRRSARAARDGDAHRPSRWARLIERHPVVTIVVFVAGLALTALPLKDLGLALPDNGTAEPGSSARETFDVIAEGFGPGSNAPLVITADMITSTDPLATVAQLADELRTIDGVASVSRETPNPGADMALIRIVPEYAQSDPRTHDLVETIRDVAPQLEEATGVSNLVVTGVTAVSIDVSARLTGALIPFGVVVVGLSFLLSMLVFRSIAIPVKATVGFVLSVGAAFGAVAAIYGWGWFAEIVNVARVGPVISFLPIITLGVLFGLSMDYEVFLVSRIREEYVRTGDAQLAIRIGYAQSGRVVNAAGVIMIAVFAAFIPHGSATLQPIAVALATGVFVDAFIVRATLARAVLVFLGDRAWWMPAGLERALPRLDIEGVALEKQLAMADRVSGKGPIAAYSSGAAATTRDGVRVPIRDLLVVPGAIGALIEPDDVIRWTTTAALTGGLRRVDGTLEVLGRVLPEESAVVRRQAVLCGGTTFSGQMPTAQLTEVVRRYLLARGGPRSVRGSAVTAVLGRVDALGRLHGPTSAHREHTWAGQTPISRLSAFDRRLLDLCLADAVGARLIVVDDLDVDLSPDETAGLANAAATLVGADRAVLLAGRHTVGAEPRDPFAGALTAVAAHPPHEAEEARS